MSLAAEVEASAPWAAAAARSLLYRELAASLRFPGPEAHALARDGGLAARLRDAVALLPFPVPGAEPLLDGLADVAADYESFQSDWVGLFEVGPGGPPCPLHGGAWGGDRRRTMEEALRFYRFFGLTLARPETALPDHVGTELEFLHFLAWREAEGLRTGDDAAPYRRAARDFLLRHPARWLPLAARRLELAEAPRFWRSLAGLAAACCTADATHL